MDEWAKAGRPLFDPEVGRFPVPPEAGATAAQVVRGAAEPGGSDVTTLVRALLLLARRRLRIVTAYFAPDKDTADLLCAAARSGVDLEVLLPGPHCTSGSLHLDEEVALTVFDASVVERLDLDFAGDPDRWTRRPLGRQALEGALAVAKRYF